MDQPPFRVRIRNLMRECVHWFALEWRFHASIAIGGAILFFAWSIHQKNGGPFSRWGAVMAAISLVMMARRFLRGTENTYLRDTGEADRAPFQYWHPFASKSDAAARDGNAMRWGLGIGIAGTAIWGFGDMLISSLRS